MGFFSSIFSKFSNTVQKYTNFKFMNGWSPTFSSFGDDIYKSQVTRAAVDAIARNAAKFNPVHIYRKKTEDGVDEVKIKNDKLERIISQKPNPMMGAYAFYYKVFTQMETKNNAFVLIERDGMGNVDMLIPVSYASAKAVEYRNLIFIEFMLNNGTKVVLPYDDLLHLRKFFYDKDIFGEDNTALLPTLELINTVNEGISNAVVSSASLRGVLSATGVMSPEDMKKARNDFVKDYLGTSNNGGVAMTDKKLEFKAIESQPKLVNKDQMQAIKTEVYDYFGVSDVIIQSKSDENEWNAFYESKLEPMALQLGQEMTNKIFTERERALGHVIQLSSNKLAFASNKTKINMVKEVGVLGALTINEVREIFNMGAIDGGEKRIQTLNVVDAAKANMYQGVGEDESEDDDDE
jgi:HK97 family phage portal protein